MGTVSRDRKNIPPKSQSRRDGAKTGRFLVRRAANRAEMGIGVPGKRNRDSVSSRKDTRVYGRSSVRNDGRSMA